MENTERAQKIAEAVWKPNLSQRRIEQIVLDGLNGAVADERRAIKQIVRANCEGAWWLGEAIGKSICDQINGRSNVD